MLDLDTGTITYAEPPVTIGPGLTRSEFLRSALAAGAKTLVENEPWHSWTLSGTYLADMRFAVALYFYGEELAMIDMSNADPKFGTSWSDWSEANELARKASHDAWLAKAAGMKRQFAWGHLASEYDQKGGASQLMICYPAWR